MGDDVLCGGYINFTSGVRQHSYSDPDLPLNRNPGSRTCINIGSDVWIGNNSVICADIGNRVIIGAGSTIMHP
jgi:virginiamycin A acetyltransferase